MTVETTTGEIVSTYSSEQEPLGVTHVRCGNRRASEVPVLLASVRRGDVPADPGRVAGGKTVPDLVAENPLVFATPTAPSFAPVHGPAMVAAAATPHSGNEPIG